MTTSTLRGRLAATALVAGLVAGLALPATVAAPAAAAEPAVIVPVASPTPAARQNASFGIGPSNGRGIDGRSALTFLASPGSTLVDRIAVVNLSSRRTTLALYAADAAANADGSIGYQPRSAKATDAARWIRLRTPSNATTITLAPRQTRVVPLQISVPFSAAPGDHVAGVIAGLTAKVRNRSGQLIDFEQRVALRASFRISGTLRPQLSVSDLSASYAGRIAPFAAGSAHVSYTVRNTGNVALGARQRVTVSGLFGEDGARAADVPLLLPGGAAKVEVTVPDVLPQLRLTARVSLYPLVVKGTADPGLPGAFSSTTGFWAVPWSLLVVLLLLVVAAAGAVVLRRHHRRTDTARHRPRPENPPALSPTGVPS